MHPTSPRGGEVHNSLGEGGKNELDMAGGVNKVILVGNLGADPDMRYTPSGQGVCELCIATSESWNDKNGQRQERTEWHRVVVWGKRAEVCSKYLSKGRQVFVEGRIQTRTYDDKD